VSMVTQSQRVEWCQVGLLLPSVENVVVVRCKRKDWGDGEVFIPVCSRVFVQLGIDSRFEGHAFD